MHHAVEAGREDLFKAGAVGELSVDEFHIGRDSGLCGVGKVVVDQNGMALLGENASDRPTNVPSSARDQNSQLSLPPILYAKWVPAASDFLYSTGKNPSTAKA